MATHYDVLGVSPSVTVEDLRRAYLGLARSLHPDRMMGAAPEQAEQAARRMQEVNEAWRVLRDPSSRAAYDRYLQGGRRPSRGPSHAATPEAPPTVFPGDDDDDDLDTPFTSAPAEPGDVGVSVVRALPWVALVVLLVAIFVFTAFAGGNDDGDDPSDLVGQCVTSGNASSLSPVPCEGPNDGEVVLITDRASRCPAGSSARSVSDSRWLCVRPVNEIPPPGAVGS